MKIAILHDWLVTYAGSERVLEQLLALYPDADLYCMVDFLKEEQRDFLQGKLACTSIIQAVTKFEQVPQWSAEACRENALHFSIEIFKQQFSDFVTTKYNHFLASHG